MRNSADILQTRVVSCMAKESKKRIYAMTPEERESQMILLAMNEVEERIRNHTATSQELTHFLKLGTAREQLEMEKLKRETELLTAKAELVRSQKRYDELIDNAISAMARYNGQDDEEDYSSEYEYVDE